MKTHGQDPARRVGGLCADAFTLTELIVVVAVIALLMGILTPSLHEAIKLTYRSDCGANVRAIASACSQYALADRRRRLPTIFTRDSDDPNFPANPDNNPGWQTWPNFEAENKTERGNPSCLWLLVSEKRVARSAFLCPAAAANRGWKEPDIETDHFIIENEGDDANAIVSTLSYSFITMARKWNWQEKLAEKMTLDGASGTLVIVADANPRCVFGQPAASMISRDAMQALVDSAETTEQMLMVQNSLNHRRQGQNMARLGGSVHWSDDPNGPNEDNIYSSAVESDDDELKGRRKDKSDSFLIP